MPKYSVLVTRDVTQHCYVEVEAASPDEAEDQACQEARRRPQKWELDANFYEPYICDPGECATEVTKDEETA